MPRMNKPMLEVLLEDLDRITDATLKTRRRTRKTLPRLEQVAVVAKLSCIDSIVEDLIQGVHEAIAVLGLPKGGGQ